MSDTLEFFASAIPGTERALCDELRELGFASVRLNRGGIPFRGAWEEGWRACLTSRIAQRIQVLLSRFPAPTQEALYSGIQAVDWDAHISYRQTLSVASVCRGSKLTHSGFAALKVKDAIVDQIRSRHGKRPSVARDDPDVRVFLYLVADRAAVYLDLSGEPLHRRGYRMTTGAAPLRETLAAALLRFSGWDRKMPLIDPMCGSGAIAIEAAQWAANHAPGLARERFGFERWAGFGDREREAMRSLRGELRRSITGRTPRIQACDIDDNMLDMAKANARAASVKLAFRHRPLRDQQGSDTRTLVVTNPPYGVRLGVDREFCRDAAAVFSRLHGWRVCLLAGSDDYEKMMPLPPSGKIPLSNGDIDCHFLTYEIP